MRRTFAAALLVLLAAPLAGAIPPGTVLTAETVDQARRN